MIDNWCIENDFAAQRERADREVIRKCTNCKASDSTVEVQEAKIKRLRSILEDIMEMPLSSETDYILEQNRYFRELAQKALQEDK